MATFSSVTRQHVLAAIAEHDSRGADDFLAVYGFTPSGGTLAHEGRSYDARAVLAVAHRFATGRLATAEEFHGDLHAVEVLRRRGFEVTAPASARRATSGGPTSSRTPSTRSVRTPRPPRTASRAAAREAAPAVCPTCSMALPATGVCDYCA